MIDMVLGGLDRMVIQRVPKTTGVIPICAGWDLGAYERHGPSCTKKADTERVPGRYGWAHSRGLRMGHGGFFVTRAPNSLMGDFHGVVVGLTTHQRDGKQEE